MVNQKVLVLHFCIYIDTTTIIILTTIFTTILTQLYLDNYINHCVNTTTIIILTYKYIDDYIKATISAIDNEVLFVPFSITHFLFTINLSIIMYIAHSIKLIN